MSVSRIWKRGIKGGGWERVLLEGDEGELKRVVREPKGEDGSEAQR